MLFFVTVWSAAFLLAGWTDSWESIRKHAAEIKTVQADFVQEKHMQILSRPLISKGAFLYTGSGSLRWEYTDPVKSVLLMHEKDIKRFTQKDSVLEEDSGANLVAMEVVLNEISQWLGGRFTENPDFIATLDAENQKILLKPREKALSAMISRIELVLSKTPGLMETVTIYESEDSFTRLTFQDTRLNETIDDTRFKTP